MALSLPFHTHAGDPLTFTFASHFAGKEAAAALMTVMRLPP